MKPVGRVLIGLTEISGYACNLREGLAELGVEAEVLDLQPGAFRFGDDVAPTRLMRLLQRVSRARLAAPRRPLGRRRLLEGIQIVLLPAAFVQAIFRYQTFVFLFDTSFLRQRELPLLRLLGKHVVYIFCGSDDRPTYLDGGLMSAPEATVESCIAAVRRKKRLLRRIERHASFVVTNPAHGLFHERPFVSFQMIGIPRVVPAGVPDDPPGERPLVVHAPTHPVAKGTAVVRATVERLRERGFEFDYEEIRGVTNDVLRERLRRAAFVVDQVWGDTPMDGLAADAALFGKPTVVSGYAWEEHRRLLPSEAFPPSELCDPDGLEAAIGRLLTDEEYRVELGARARLFVTERWEATAVARRLLDLLEGHAPAEWLCEPSSLRYLLGWGQPAERSVELVRAVVELGGAEALGLSDKPEVEAALLELAGAGAAPVADPPRRTRPVHRAGT